MITIDWQESYLVPLLDDLVIWWEIPSTSSLYLMFPRYSWHREIIFWIVESQKDDDYERYFKLCSFKEIDFIHALEHVMYRVLKRRRETSHYTHRVLHDPSLKGSNLLEYPSSISNILFQLQNGYLDSCLYPFVLSPPEQYRIPTNPQQSHSLVGSKESKLFIICLGGITFSEIQQIQKVKNESSIDIVIGTTSFVNNDKVIECLYNLY